MKRDFDWRQLDDIPDPFAGTVGTPALHAPSPSPELRAAMGESRSRGSLRLLRAAALAIALAYEIVAVAVYTLRPDVDSLPAWLLALGFLIPAVGAAFALAAAMRQGDRGLGQSPLRLRLLTLGTPILFVAATWLALPHPGDAAFWPHAVACMVTTGVLGAVPALFAAAAIRRSFVASAGWRAAALGVACGALAATAISLICANEDACHVIVGHGTATLVLGALGAIAGSRFARA